MDEKAIKKKFTSENGIYGSRVSQNGVYSKFVNKHKKL